MAMMRGNQRRGRGLHGWIVEELGQTLVDGGPDALPSLDPVEIAARYGVSRTVVREALRVLEAKGMVSARPNVGTRLRPASEWNLLDPQVIAWRVHSRRMSDQMQELLELRTAIEPFAARLAATRIGPEQRRSLVAARDALVAALHAHDLAAFTRADIDLHVSLIEGSGNPMIAQLATVVSEALLAREELQLSPETLSPHATDLHVQLVDAVVASRVEEAEARMRELLATVSHSFGDGPPAAGA